MRRQLIWWWLVHAAATSGSQSCGIVATQCTTTKSLDLASPGPKRVNWPIRFSPEQVYVNTWTRTGPKDFHLDHCEELPAGSKPCDGKFQWWQQKQEAGVDFQPADVAAVEQLQSETSALVTSSHLFSPCQPVGGGSLPGSSAALMPWQLLLLASRGRKRRCNTNTFNSKERMKWLGRWLHGSSSSSSSSRISISAVVVVAAAAVVHLVLLQFSWPWFSDLRFCGPPTGREWSWCGWGGVYLQPPSQSVSQSGYFGPWLTESMFLRATRKQCSLLGLLCNTLSLFLQLNIAAAAAAAVMAASHNLSRGRENKPCVESTEAAEECLIQSLLVIIN